MTDMFNDMKKTTKQKTKQLPIDIYNMEYTDLCWLRNQIEQEIERRLMTLPY